MAGWSELSFKKDDNCYLKILFAGSHPKIYQTESRSFHFESVLNSKKFIINSNLNIVS